MLVLRDYQHVPVMSQAHLLESTDILRRQKQAIYLVHKARIYGILWCSETSKWVSPLVMSKSGLKVSDFFLYPQSLFSDILTVVRQCPEYDLHVFHTAESSCVFLKEWLEKDYHVSEK